MSDRNERDRANDAPTTTRTLSENADELRVAEGPLKQEGDALRDGSGSRQGQSPPNTGPTESR